MKCTRQFVCKILFVMLMISILTPAMGGSLNATVAYHNYVNTSMSKEQCLSVATQVLKSAEFTNVKISTTSAFGVRGPYGAFIRSIPEKHMAFICVYGPEGGNCEKLANYLKSAGAW